MADLPREFRSRFIAPFNAQSLAVYEALKAEAALGWQQTGFRALAILFFPDLQRIFTAWLQLRLERQLGILRPDLATMARPSLPFSAVADLDHGPNPADKVFRSAAEEQDRASSRLVRMAERLLSRPWRRPAVGVRRDTNFGTAAVIKTVLRAGGWPVVVPNIRPDGISMEREWPPMRQRLDAMLHRLDLAEDQRRNLLDVAERYMRANLRTPVGTLACDILVCGGTAGMGSRLVAAQARLQGLPVISITHGESDGALDEPYFGFGEYTYATHVLSFGTATTETYARSRYMGSLFEPDDRPVFVPSNADTVLPVFDAARPIRPLVRTPESRGLYVSCTFNGLNICGPFRSLPDSLYHRWHRHLLDSFPDARIKLHPNSDWTEAAYPPDRAVGGVLTEVMRTADYFIFDYVSTALTQAMATDKPILYFDIGLRHLDAEAKAAIAERCIWITVEDLLDPTLEAQAMAQAGRSFGNRVTPRFSLDGRAEPRIAALERTIRELTGIR